MIGLRSLVFNFVFYGFTTALALLMLPALVLPRGAYTVIARLWATIVDRLLVAIVGVRIEVRGAERLRGARLIACKHQSAWETIALNRLLADPCFVLKRELTWIPVFGWYLLKTRQVVVDRSGGARALKAMLRDARAAVAAGRQVVIFPEGTRVEPGLTRPYQAGVVALYRHLGVPVVPVAVNSGLAWGRRAFVKLPRLIVLSVLEPIPPGLGRRDFTARLQAAIETEARALEGEAISSSHARSDES